MQETLSRDPREREPLGMAEFRSPGGDPFVKYRGEPDEDLGAPENSPIDQTGRSTANLLRSDEEISPVLAGINFGSTHREDGH